MKILLVTEFYPDKRKYFSGGVETRTFFTAQYLAKKNKVTVICRRKNGEKKEEISGNLRIIRLGGQTKKTEVKFFSIVPRLTFIVQSLICGLNKEAEIIEGSNFICFIPAFALSYFKKIPSVAWYPDLYGREWFKNYGFLTGGFGFVLEKIGTMLSWSGVIALSRQTEKKLIKTGMERKKINVIYGGVDLNFINKIKSKKYKQPTICCISRLVPYKKIDCLIKAASEVKLKIPELKCIIIGKGPEEGKLNKLIRKLRLEKNIILKKDLSYKNLIKTLKASHIFCLPSIIEGFGLTTIEALASGIPFVVADTPVNREITKNKGGLFFKPNSSENLSEQISRLLTDKKLSLNLLKEGKPLINVYNWRKISQQTEKFYSQILNMHN